LAIFDPPGGSPGPPQDPPQDPPRTPHRTRKSPPEGQKNPPGGPKISRPRDGKFPPAHTRKSCPRTRTPDPHKRSDLTQNAPGEKICPHTHTHNPHQRSDLTQNAPGGKKCSPAQKISPGTGKFAHPQKVKKNRFFRNDHSTRPHLPATEMVRTRCPDPGSLDSNTCWWSGSNAEPYRLRLTTCRVPDRSEHRDARMGVVSNALTRTETADPMAQ
jgi:hypothetical protein